MRTVEHQFAENAYMSIARISENYSHGIQEYGRLCHTFPNMVLMNGLRLTIAFFKSKSQTKDGKPTMHGQYLNDLGNALGVNGLAESIPEEASEYRHLTVNALKASAWFKRYAEGILKVGGADQQ